VWNRRRVVYYAILLLLISGELLGEINYIIIIFPEYDITRKDEKWRWEEAQQKVFNELKQVFTTKPVLAAPDLDKEFRVKVDALNYATGGILSMKCLDKKWRLVAFISKFLSDTERNYKIHDKEMLAVVRCLEA